MTTYTYDYRNRLTEVEVGGTIVATYTYDALNNRIGIDDNGTQTWTVYDGTNPYADFNGSGALEERYQSGPGMVDGAVVDELLARTSASGTTAWYLTDKLDSVRDIVNSSGTDLDHIVYDSFGNIVRSPTPSEGDRFKFAGMEYDGVIGQYYDQARWYDPGTGRFDSEDPTGFSAGDANLFRYVGNDSTDLVDPTGLAPPSESQSPTDDDKPTGGVGVGSPTQLINQKAITTVGATAGKSLGPSMNGANVYPKSQKNVDRSQLPNGGVAMPAAAPNQSKPTKQGAKSAAAQSVSKYDTPVTWYEVRARNPTLKG